MIPTDDDRRMYRLITAINGAQNEADLEALMRDPLWQEDWRTLKSKEHRAKVIDHGRTLRARLSGATPPGSGEPSPTDAGSTE